MIKNCKLCGQEYETFFKKDITSYCSFGCGEQAKKNRAKLYYQKKRETFRKD